MIGKTILSACLVLGIVDQISNGIALVEYESSGTIEYIGVYLEDALCTPVEGQKVEMNNGKIVHSYCSKCCPSKASEIQIISAYCSLRRRSESSNMNQTSYFRIGVEILRTCASPDTRAGVQIPGLGTQSGFIRPKMGPQEFDLFGSRCFYQIWSSSGPHRSV